MPSLRRLSRDPVVVVTLVGFILRVALVLVQQRFAIFDINFEAADSTIYRELAASLFRGDGFALDGRPTAYVTPGFPLFLSGLYLLSPSTVFIALVHAVLGAATCGLIAALGLRLGGKVAAWSAGLFSAFYPHLIFWTGYVLTETLYVFLLILSLYLLVRAVEVKRPTWGLCAGIVFGLAVLTRPIALGFALVVAIAGLVVTDLRKTAAVGLAGLSVITGVWAVRNAIVLGSPIVTSAESGYVLWQGNSPGATGGTRGYVDAADFRPLQLPPGIDEVEADRIYRREATRWIVSHPGTFLSLVPKKLWNMWRPTYQGASTVNTIVTLATYPLLLVGAVWGLWLIRKERLLFFLFASFVLYHLIVHGSVTGMIRFRLPVEAALFPPFGAACAWLWAKRAP